MGEEMQNQNNVNVGNTAQSSNVTSMWVFVGLQILFAIPCVGLICAIVFACGTTKNQNITNYARANLIILGIAVVIYLIMLMFGVGASIFSGAQSAVNSGYYY